MAIKYIFIIILAPIVVLLIFLLTKRNKKSFKKGHKVANTHITKKHKKYQKYVKLYRILSSIILVGNVLAILVAAVLSSRVYTNKTVSTTEYNRDIIFCFDVSKSIGKYNIGAIEAAREIVKSLDKERVGVTTFISSAYLYVPLTEDYEYLDSALTELKSAISVIGDGYGFGSEYSKASNLIYGGTLSGSDRGSSLIGDGLASCIYDFPDLETTSRSRNIILITDNDVIGNEYVTVPEAADIAQKYGVTIYSIAPYGINDEDAQGMKDASAKTGGEFYSVEDSSAVKGIVANINQQEKSKIDNPSRIITIDYPEVLVISLVVIIAIMFSIEWWLLK